MKTLDTDETLYVLPTGLAWDNADYDDEDYEYHLTNMTDDYLINYTKLDTDLHNTVEVRTTNSDCVGIAGANIDAVTVHTCTGTVHDGSDIFDNGAFLLWTGLAPDDWTIETNVDHSEGSTDITVGGYNYTKFIRLNRPTGFSADISVTQTQDVTASTKYKLTFTYRKYLGGSCGYYIYDESNLAFIKADTLFPDPPSNGSAGKGTLHVVFDTPVGCTSITIGFKALDETSNYLDIYGASLRAITESFTQDDVTDNRKYADTQFITYAKEYTKIVGSHSVVLELTTSQSQIKIGKIGTGTLSENDDPAPTMGQGLILDSPVVDLKYGGQLGQHRFNLDSLDCSLVLTEDDAHEFMFTLVPTIKGGPRFFILGALATQNWTVFGRFEDMPVMQNKGKYKNITFRLIEAI